MIKPVPQPPVEVLKAIYSRCRRDSRIAFGSRRGGAEGPRYLTNIAVGDLDSMLPPILEHEVDETQYVMLNTLHPSHAVQPFKGKASYFKAANASVEEINALYLDLDVGRAEGAASIPAPIALGLVLMEVQEGRVPLPSLAALSGRGAYVVWLLREDDPTSPHPPRATRETVSHWKAVELELHARLSHVLSDHSATAVARWLKRPGTIDTLKVDGKEIKSGREVIYLTFGYDLARVPVYSLPQLTELLNVHFAPSPPVPALPPRLDPPPDSTPRRRHGGGRRRVKVGKGAEPYGLRVREIEAINTYRRGMKPGTRRLTLFHYFRALEAWHRINAPGSDGRAVYVRAKEQAARLNDSFDPPLPQQEFLISIKHRRVGLQRSRTRNVTVARDLKVTVAEVEALSLKSIVPAEVAEDRRERELEARVERDMSVNGVRNEIDQLLRAGVGDSEIAARCSTSRQRVRARRLSLQKQGQLQRETAAELFAAPARADREEPS